MTTIQDRIAQRVNELTNQLNQKESDQGEVIQSQIDKTYEWLQQIDIPRDMVRWTNLDELRGELDTQERDKYRLEFEVTVEGDTISLKTNCSLVWNRAKNSWVWKEWTWNAEGDYDELEETAQLSLCLSDSERIIRGPQQLEDALVSAFARKQLEGKL